ncbi:hypothetical protein [Tsuneonella dongtanensis]|uniref:hypothetical protein n=1 Tax=Tsuneonella dongtanensis TaxID=692370 RepID=UPI0018DEBCC3|nr:hypothetical protein [Tsuneonella dongtanensis]
MAALLRRRKSLQSDLRSARSERHGRTFHQADEKRIKSVVLKLGRCHVAHELNEPRPDEPRSVWWRPIMLLTAGQLDHFEHGDDGALVPWPEVGSRAMMRMMMEGTNVFGSGWLEVQQGRYRFLVSQDGGLRVRMVIREYLACEVAWD